MSESVEVFLSHSSKDLMLAEAVVELLTSSIDLLGVVRCTSAFGYSLDIGTGVARKLRKEIDECDVFLTLISVNSLSSQFCLFEMGAAWGLKKKIKPILAPNFDTSHLKPPLSDLNCLKWTSQDNWTSLIKDVAKLTSSERKKSRIVSTAVMKFCARSFSS